MTNKEVYYDIAGKMLTQKLHELARDLVVNGDIGDDGEVKMETRAEVLARKVWEVATGMEIKDGVPTFDGKPVPWAVALIFERLEGKVVPRARDNENRPDLGKRIDEQQFLKVNSITQDDS